MCARQSGVTLLELLTVVVIIGILSAIAIPSYRSYLLRTNRSDAKSALMQVQAAQEKFYLQNNAYSTNVDGKPPAGLGLSKTTTNGYYELAVASRDGTDQTYIATASPTSSGGQSDDTKCGNFQIDDTGTRYSSGTLKLADCWK